MKKLKLILSVIALTLICSNCTTISTITTITLLDDDNEYETEWNDGKLWAYKTDKDYMLGIAINPAKDHPGVFQANLIIKNNTDKSLTFDPYQIFMQFAHGVKNDTLYVYKYPLTPNVGMAAYDMGENIYQLSKMPDLKQIGYLKKNTIYAGEGIIGYLNFDLKRTTPGELIINVPVGDNTYEFRWYAGKSAQLPVYESTTKEIPITNESITTESDGNILWNYQNIGEYTIGAALCSSKDDPDNFQLKLSVKQPDGTPIQIKCKDITAMYAYGMKTGELQTGNFRTSRKQDKTEFTGYITRYKTNYEPDLFIIVVRIPIGNEIATFQWSVINN